MYQWKPGQPGSCSGPRAETTRSRPAGSSASASPSRSCSSVPRPWWRTRRPSGSPAAGRSTVTSGAIGSSILGLARRGGGGLLEVVADEAVDVAVEHALDVADLVLGAVVL